MKGVLCFFFLAIINIQSFTLSVDSTVVPWSTGLRLREEPAASAKGIVYLGLWEKLTVIEIKNETETINGNTGNWVKVRRENSKVTGWSFSYFLEEIDESNFYPILEYWGFANYTSYDPNEIYTLYNDGKRRSKLTLNWENKTIDRFDDLFVSDNGRIIVFTWMDTATIRRDNREGSMSGKRILFVYNFTTHNLMKIDEVYITQSDMYSERWYKKYMADEYEGGYADGFNLDHNLTNYCLNSNNTKLFYAKNQIGIEMSLITGIKIEHRIPDVNYDRVCYMGNYLHISKNDRELYKWNGILYDPVKRTSITGFWFIYLVGSYTPKAILNNRYLVIEESDGALDKWHTIHDLVTNQKRKIEIFDFKELDSNEFNYRDFDGGIYHFDISWKENYYYVFTSLYRRYSNVHTYIIRKINYENNILEQYVFKDITRGITLSSHSPKYIIGKNSILELTYGNINYTDNRPDSNQSWLFVYSFKNGFSQYRFDSSQTYKGSYSLYIMNND